MKYLLLSNLTISPTLATVPDILAVLSPIKSIQVVSLDVKFDECNSNTGSGKEVVSITDAFAVITIFPVTLAIDISLFAKQLFVISFPPIVTEIPFMEYPS